MARPTTTADTSARILDVAERLVQTRGFNAFSYADVAQALNLTKASLHYHFPSKADLGLCLIDRYRETFLLALDGIDAGHSHSLAKLNAYAGIYAAVLDHDRMCLCGMLAAEYASLPTAMQQAIRRFFDANETWLVKVLASGRRKNHVGFSGPPVDAARVLVAALEGALLLARSRQEPSQFRAVARRLLSDLKARAASA
jgi:TetR/AcrR family transcriptional repressor of nem operon